MQVVEMHFSLAGWLSHGALMEFRVQVVISKQPIFGKSESPLPLDFL